MRARKVRIFPDQDQTKILKRWFKGARKVYNRVVHRVRIGEIEINKFGIGNQVSTPATEEFPKTPFKILHQAAFDAYESYHSNLEKLKKRSNEKINRSERKRGRKRKNRKTLRILRKFQRRLQDSVTTERTRNGERSKTRGNCHLT